MRKFLVIFFSIFMILNYGICKPSQEIVSLDSNVYKYFIIKNIEIKNVNDRIYRIQIALPLLDSVNSTLDFVLDSNKKDSNFQKSQVIESRTFVLAKNNHKKPQKILYLLDGNAFFPRFLNLITNDIESNLSQHKTQALDSIQNLPIIVGIGHDSNLAFDRALREIDYTPNLESSKNIEAFHYFLVKILKPFIESNYANFQNLQVTKSITLDSNNPKIYKDSNNIESILFGHSFGGLYVLYNAFNYPQDFNIYFAASPSLYLNNGAIFPRYSPMLSNFKNHTLIISQGSLERASQQRFSRENLYNLLKRENPQNDIRFYDFYNKTHGESVNDAFLMLIKILKDYDRI